MSKDEMNFRATHFSMLRKKDGKWFVDKNHFRGVYSAEAAAINIGLKPGIDYLISERSWAEFIMNELNNVGNEGKLKPMLKVVKGCDDSSD